MHDIALNPLDPMPLTEQIVVEFTKRITQRALRPGARLPSIRAFAGAHGVSTSVVVDAYDRLVRSGLVRPRHGSGYYVAARKKSYGDHAAHDLSSADDMLWIMRNALVAVPQGLKVGAGWLPAAWLDQGLVQDGMRLALERHGDELHEYGSPYGHGPLREALAARLALVGVHATASQVMLTHGATGALDLVGRALIRAGDTVLVDDPGYFAFGGYAKSLGATVIGVPRLADGPDLDALERAAAEYKPRLFFTVSVLHNPTGTSSSENNARRVLRIAENHDFTLLEDDVYGDFHAAPLTRLATLDQLKRVIYVGGFSKTVSSSLRVGYIAADEQMIADLADLKLLTTLNSSSLSERIVHEVLASGLYARHMERLRQRLRDAREATLAQLRGLDLEVPFVPEAGMFIWARMPDGRDVSSLATRAAQQGIVLGPGNVFRPHQEPSPFLRFNVAYCDDARLFEFLRTAMGHRLS
ncbi:MAG: PLP-dependent aminotransferase family protein [Burkholderiales bacterium]